MLNLLANIVAELGRPSWPRICLNRGQRHIAVVGTDAMGKQIICHRAHTSEDAYHGFSPLRGCSIENGKTSGGWLRLNRTQIGRKRPGKD